LRCGRGGTNVDGVVAGTEIHVVQGDRAVDCVLPFVVVLAVLLLLLLLRVLLLLMLLCVRCE